MTGTVGVWRAFALVLPIAVGPLAGCATTNSSAPTATTDKPKDPKPSSPHPDELGLIDKDVKRIEEISRLDHENQVQTEKVQTLEKTVSELEAKLAAALER